MKSREINGERKLKGAAEATKRPTLKWADAHWISHSCFIGSLWMQMWERQKDQRNALLRGCNCTLSRHKTSSKFTASVFNTGRVAHRWTFASNYFEYYCNSTRYTVCTACWRRSRYILDTRIRVYQISISLCEVICRVSDSFWFRHAVRARSFQPKRDSFFFPSHRAKRGSPVGHHATVNLQNSNFRPLAVTWSLHAPLIKDHARNRVEMRPQICENGNLRCESSWNSCLIFLFFYVIYIYIYIFVFDRRDIVDLIENTDSL